LIDSGFTSSDEWEICSGLLFLPQKASHDKIDFPVHQQALENSLGGFAPIGFREFERASGYAQAYFYSLYIASPPEIGAE
jgi:hypothetical protein